MPGPLTEGLVKSGAEVKAMVSASTRGRWTRHNGKFQDYADNSYYLPLRSELSALVSQVEMPRGIATPEAFDCDDFALLMKARVSEQFVKGLYRKSGARRRALCFGIAWAKFSNPPANGVDHALNWSLVSTREGPELVFVEPQTSKLHPHTVLLADLKLVLA